MKLIQQLLDASKKTTDGDVFAIFGVSWRFAASVAISKEEIADLSEDALRTMLAEQVDEMIQMTETAKEIDVEGIIEIRDGTTDKTVLGEKDLSPASAMRVKTWRGLRPVAEFDEVEIHAMCDGEDGELWQATDCPGDSPVAFTVFLHCAAGGIESVQDFRFDPSEPDGEQSARQEAEMLAEQLYDMLRAAGTLLAR